MGQVKGKKRRDIDALPLTDKNSEELVDVERLFTHLGISPMYEWSPSTRISCTTLSVALGEFPECSVLQFLFFNV